MSPESSFRVSIAKAPSWLRSVTVWPRWHLKWCLWNDNSLHVIILFWWDPYLGFSLSPVLQRALRSSTGPIPSDRPFPGISVSFSRWLHTLSTELVFPSLLACFQGRRQFPKQSYGYIRKSVLKLRVKQRKKVVDVWVLLMIGSSVNMWRFHLHSSFSRSKTKLSTIDLFFLMEDDSLKGEKIPSAILHPSEILIVQQVCNPLPSILTAGWRCSWPRFGLQSQVLCDPWGVTAWPWMSGFAQS